MYRKLGRSKLTGNLVACLPWSRLDIGAGLESLCGLHASRHLRGALHACSAAQGQHRVAGVGLQLMCPLCHQAAANTEGMAV